MSRIEDKLYKFMEDFDNSELPLQAWQEQLEDAVVSFNEEYETNYDPRDSFIEYVNRINSAAPPIY